ncbi:MAG: hydrolase [Eubacterium sp.]|jgi:hypothetical protein|nr:hydrolase [Eubacterium sp.]
MQFQLAIESNGELWQPSVLDGVSWETERRGSPGKLSFNVLRDDFLKMEEGSAVGLSVDGKDVFHGNVFSRKFDKQLSISVTAYDQIRYLKNKDTIYYDNKTASDVIEMIAGDYGIRLGDIEKTDFIISDRNEKNTSLLDIFYNALDLELTHAGKMFVLYDDYGKLCLKTPENMEVPICINEGTAENFDYNISIDNETYNKVKLIYEDSDSGGRAYYDAKDLDNIKKWGLLQYFESIKKGEVGQTKANNLLKMYNAPTRSLKIKNVVGDVRVRAGSLVTVKLNLGDMAVDSKMLVEKCSHVWNESEHWMDLTLRSSMFY